MQLTKVISTKTMFGDKAAVQRLVLENEKDAHFLYRVGGECTGFVEGSTLFQGQEKPSEWTKLVGDFRARSHDGEEWESPICFLPSYLVPTIKSQFGEGVMGVTFVYDIFAQYDARSATSYVFLAKPVKETGKETTADTLWKTLPPLEPSKRLAAPKKKE